MPAGRSTGRRRGIAHRREYYGLIRQPRQGWGCRLIRLAGGLDAAAAASKNWRAVRQRAAAWQPEKTGMGRAGPGKGGIRGPGLPRCTGPCSQRRRRRATWRFHSWSPRQAASGASNGVLRSVPQRSRWLSWYISDCRPYTSDPPTSTADPRPPKADPRLPVVDLRPRLGCRPPPSWQRKAAAAATIASSAIDRSCYCAGFGQLPPRATAPPTSSCWAGLDPGGGRLPLVWCLPRKKRFSASSSSHH